MDAIRNPVVWCADEVMRAAHHLKSVGHSIRGGEQGETTRLPVVRQISTADLREVLTKGFSDFGACRTDVAFICIVYPFIGLLLVTFAFNYAMLPLLFPIASGFALVGPLAGAGLYEMSKRREANGSATWADAFRAIQSPSFGAIVALGLVLLAIFFVWLVAAQVIYAATLGPEPPVSMSAFLGDVFTTGAGWAMIIVGFAVGFLFAVVVFTISVVSFPLLLDRNVGLVVAVRTSVSVVIANPRPMAIWGLIVAGGLVLGSIPVLLGLVIVMPVLGHATWHLYRKTVDGQ